MDELIKMFQSVMGGGGQGVQGLMGGGAEQLAAENEAMARSSEMQAKANAGLRYGQPDQQYKDMSNFANVGGIKSLMHSSPRQPSQRSVQPTPYTDQYLKSLMGG
jgi:hypothetical protein